jgi:hypothetical protein
LKQISGSFEVASWIQVRNLNDSSSTMTFFSGSLLR